MVKNGLTKNMNRMKQTFKGIDTTGRPILKESANRITANVLRVINMQPNCVADRINNVGVWDEKKKIRRKGNTRKGLHDIYVCVYGFFLTIEVKAGADKLSDEQKMRAFEITTAKGTFFEARSTDSFLDWWPEFYQRKKAEFEALEMYRKNFNPADLDEL